jgi:hypothetical protein
MTSADMGPFQFTFSDYMYELLGIKVVIIKGLTENGINRNTDGMLSKFFYLPTDAQEKCFKNNIKIYTKTAPTCFGAITIIRERIS